MQTLMTARHMELTEGIKERMNEKMAVLDRVAPENSHAEIVMSVEKIRQKVEVTLHANGRIIHAEAVTNDLYGSMDLVIEKLQRQLVKFKERLGHNRTTGVMPVPTESSSPKTLPPLVKSKRFPVKPMNQDDAIFQMELLDQDFFLYLDSSDQVMMLLYRRRDGSLGQIRPEY